MGVVQSSSVREVRGRKLGSLPATPVYRIYWVAQASLPLTGMPGPCCVCHALRRPAPPEVQVEVLEEADGWMLVRDPSGREGLVPTSYLHLDALYQQASPRADPPA